MKINNAEQPVGGDELAELANTPFKIGQAVIKAAAGQELGALDALLSLLATAQRTRNYDAQGNLGIALAQAADRPHGAAPFVRVLLAAGAPARTDTAAFPLWRVAAAGDTESLRLLLDGGADPNAWAEDPREPDTCRLPLFGAIRGGSAESVAVLLDAGADPNLLTPAPHRPLDVALDLGDAAIIDLLRERGAEVLSPDDLDLDQAAARGFAARVRELLPSQDSFTRARALDTAVRGRQLPVVAAILEYGGAGPDALMSAFRNSLYFGLPEAVPLVIGAGLDIDAPDDYDGAPPIVFAAQQRSVAAVRALITAGADLQARDRQGQDALGAARSTGNQEAVQLLQAAGAVARRRVRSHAAIVRALRKRLADRARGSWAPELGRPDETAAGLSRFGGLPVLRAGEAWPVCGDCEAPLTFFAQVDLARIPPTARARFGPGLLQVFFCTACNPHRTSHDERRVRIIDTAGTATVTAAPDGARVLPLLPVMGWGPAVKDYPYREAQESELPTEEKDVLFELNRQGHKLGGWPNWVQDPEYPRCPQGDHLMDGMLLQINSGPAHRWGDNGAAYVLRCPEHPDRVAFLWQSA
ncbi:ankyrin repeat domain-containing protein [Streptomyces sp. NBC_01508]|uniref:ankyrin repeat domain-containing protein n=1 Tax=Streptomyces sp. NBC_01508 TaxID=2903888 RepID=UPI003869E67B